MGTEDLTEDLVEHLTECAKADDSQCSKGTQRPFLAPLRSRAAFLFRLALLRARRFHVEQSRLGLNQANLFHGNT